MRDVMISPADILKASILIVDDQEANIAMLEQMLREAGYVSIASTTYPSNVCELHRTRRYDLILLDLQMPGMDGFQVMGALKEIETDGYLPVLVITAQPGQKLSALKGGAKDFVSKPFDLGEVLIRVHNMLEVRLLHLEIKRLFHQLVADDALLVEEISELAGAVVRPRGRARGARGRAHVGIGRHKQAAGGLRRIREKGQRGTPGALPGVAGHAGEAQAADPPNNHRARGREKADQPGTA
jgi:CheY-like chemotaxis protein